MPEIRRQKFCGLCVCVCGWVCLIRPQKKLFYLYSCFCELKMRALSLKWDTKKEKERWQRWRHKLECVPIKFKTAFFAFFCTYFFLFRVTWTGWAFIVLKFFLDFLLINSSYIIIRIYLVFSACYWYFFGIFCIFQKYWKYCIQINTGQPIK